MTRAGHAAVRGANRCQHHTVFTLNPALPARDGKSTVGVKKCIAMQASAFPIDISGFFNPFKITICQKFAVHSWRKFRQFSAVHEAAQQVILCAKFSLFLLSVQKIYQVL